MAGLAELEETLSDVGTQVTSCGRAAEVARLLVMMLRAAVLATLDTPADMPAQDLSFSCSGVKH